MVDGRGPLTGVDSINQSIVEMCIYKEFPEYFLTYFFGFHKCFVTDSNAFRNCDGISKSFVKSVHKKAEERNFDFKIKECYKTNTISNPHLLRDEYKLFID